MSPEVHRRAAELFDRLRDVAEHELIPTLDAACGGDAELRSHVLFLIEGDRDAARRGFLERRAMEDAARQLTPQLLGLPAPGTTLGNYRLGERIGGGGMGIVYEGHDLRLNRRVAIKILQSAPPGQGAERIVRFQREANAASSLNHPNIVSIFDADCDQGYHYIAMEFVEGRTLRQIATPGTPIAVHDILDWLSQTASALSAAHEAGIVHRDIKPENIMVRPDGFVKVLDFGLAKLREPVSGETRGPDFQTRPGCVTGTVQYLSPEQVLGKTVGPRSDLFGLGVVAYELSTGQRPFDGPTDGAVMNAIVNHIPPPPSQVNPAVDPQLDALILRALEKDPELRFQSAADLRSTCRQISLDHVVRTVEKEGTVTRPRSLGTWLLIAPFLLASAAIAAVWINRPQPPPRPLEIVQVTEDRLRKEHFVNDGTRIYYAAGMPDPEIAMFQVNAKGGEPLRMPRLTGMFPLDISPDRSEILFGQYLKGTINGPYPIWIADTLGNGPRRVGDLMAIDARWSPQGSEIVYTTGRELRTARSDGSVSRKLAALDGVIKYPAWSPDGRSIRFTLVAMNAGALWEIRPDGTGLHRLFPGWAGYQQEQGVWTPDGNYYIFSARQIVDTRDLWAIGRGGRFWDFGSPAPVRLVNGPLVSVHPEVSPDGHRVFFLGNPNRGELVRYDAKSNQWLPYLAGVAATQLDYSRDGKWVTYASCPEGSIWKIASDGTRRVQLTTPPLFGRNPRWSPDGSQIAFYGARPGQPDRIYLVAAAGGAVRELTHGEAGPSGDTDASWSPDGASIVFGAQSADERVRKLPLDMLDLKTLRTSKLPGTAGLWSPRWSPDGRYIAALGFPIHTIWLYDVAARAAKEVTSIGAGFPGWSRDSHYIYFEDNAATQMFRIRIPGGKPENLGPVNLRLAATGLGWVGLSLDGSMIATRDTGSTEIYAFDW